MDQMTKEQQLQALGDIRSLMERSSRFISLSGLSGVGAGVCALLGSAAAQWRISHYQGRVTYLSEMSEKQLIWELVGIATLTLVAALAVGAFFTLRKAHQQQQRLWDKSVRQLLAHFFFPLVIGGLFGLILIKHRMVGMVAPTTLIFYGLALVSASRYTLNDIRYLGFAQVGLGLLNAWWMGTWSGILFWTIGFGLLHIVYGIYLHYKYR